MVFGTFGRVWIPGVRDVNIIILSIPDIAVQPQ